MPGSEEAGRHFDRFHADYDEALARGLAVSGEDRLYFAHGRIAFLAGCLRDIGHRAASVLDFGCGTGTATPFFLDDLGAQRVLGVDASERSLEVARARHGSARVRFLSVREFEPRAEFPLVFCNGVFHHVPPAERPDVVGLLRDSLQPGGLFALWDNNPWNPGARLVMRRIPFDRGAVMLSSREGRRLLEAAGLEVVRTDALFFFPRALRFLRFLEPRLVKVPLGAQYQLLARKPFARPDA
jgi:SAM-dependent methyltransferase